jgi:hypothetical protein
MCWITLHLIVIIHSDEAERVEAPGKYTASRIAPLCGRLDFSLSFP